MNEKTPIPPSAELPSMDKKKKKKKRKKTQKPLAMRDMIFCVVMLVAVILGFRWIVLEAKAPSKQSNETENAASEGSPAEEQTGNAQAQDQPDRGEPNKKLADPDKNSDPADPDQVVQGLTKDRVRKMIDEKIGDNLLTPEKVEELVQSITKTIEASHKSTDEVFKEVSRNLERIAAVLEKQQQQQKAAANQPAADAQFDPNDPLGLKRIEALDRESTERKRVLGNTLKDALRIAGIKTLTNEQYEAVMGMKNQVGNHEKRLWQVERVQKWYNIPVPARPFPPRVPPEPVPPGE